MDGDGCRPSRIVKDMSRPPTLLFWNGMLIQFFHLYEVGWFVSGVHIQFFHLYEVATVGNICEDGCKPPLRGGLVCFGRPYTILPPLRGGHGRQHLWGWL